MFRRVKIKFKNRNGSAWFSVPIIKIVSEKYRSSYSPTEFRYNPNIQNEWEEFIKFAGCEDAKDWTVEDLNIDDPVVNWIHPDTAPKLYSYIIKSINRMDFSHIEAITDVLDAYYDLFRNKGILYDTNLWLRICRCADVFMNVDNTESSNKLLLCLNDAKLWCVDNRRGTNSILYGVDINEEFDEDGRGRDSDVKKENEKTVTKVKTGPINNPFDYSYAKKVFAVSKSSDEMGIYSIKLIDRIEKEDDKNYKHNPEYQVVFYDVSYWDDPVNVFSGRIFRTYEEAKDAMYSYCDSIGCEFYSTDVLDKKISELVASFDDPDDKICAIEYGHRVVKEILGS